MATEKSQKIANNFWCEKCDYTTSNLYDYNKHIKTQKHLINDKSTLATEKSQKSQYGCSCGKTYKDKSGLWRHKKKCTDEYLSNELLQNLPEILELNPEIESYFVPRINTVEGLTPSHVLKWGWRVNEKGWVNYPDLQQRIFKNLDKIKWVNKVHEQIVGARTAEPFPDGFNLNLIHPKTIERQEKQNNFYESI